MDDRTLLVIADVCRRAAAGDLEARLPELGDHPGSDECRAAVNAMLDASDAFVREALEFLGSDWNSKAKGGASQTGVLVAMYVFMFDYALWAEECPNFSRHGLGNTLQVPEYTILDALAKNQAGGILYDASQNLLDK